MMGKKLWLVIMTSLFFLVSATPTFAYYKSPIDLSNDKYIRFGDDDHPWTEEYGMQLHVQTQSISSQWVNLDLKLWSGLIKQRKIDKFLILANNKIVEEFRPIYIKRDDGTLDWSGFYTVKPSIPEMIGGDLWFQIVAIQTHDGKEGNGQYAVAWTDLQGPFRFQDLPVKDKEANATLYAILAKLKDMLATLNKMSQQLATMFTPTPEASRKLEEAAMDLLKKTPIDDLARETNKIKKMFENTSTNRPYSELAFGEKRDWFGIGYSHYLFDLTEWRKEVEMVRTLLDAVVWVSFFFFLIRYLQPKLMI